MKRPASPFVLRLVPSLSVLLLFLVFFGAAAADLTSQDSPDVTQATTEVFANGEVTGGVQVTVPAQILTGGSVKKLEEFLYDQWVASTSSSARAKDPSKLSLFDVVTGLITDERLADFSAGRSALPQRLYWVPSHRLFLHPVVKIGDRVALRNVYDYLQPHENSAIGDSSPGPATGMMGWIADKIHDWLGTERPEASETETAAHVPVHSPDTEVILESLSESPRVFFVENFFTDAEADQIIQNVFDEESGVNKLARSTVGHRPSDKKSGQQPRHSDIRTSMNAFDSHSEVAMRIKKRAFRLLRVPEWDPSMSDGLQVLRYQLGQAYIAHNDYFKIGTSDDHNWDPAAGGTNRFATVFLYLSDVEEGGQTVFNHAPRSLLEQTSHKPPPVDTEKVNALKSRMVEMFGEDSWQTKMVEQCYSQLAVYPRKGSAVLFYHQLADGELDPQALHGGCPVLEGEKFAANLWVWNGPRHGHKQAPKPDASQQRQASNTKPGSIAASFTNDLDSPVKLFWEQKLWKELQPGDEARVNTFAGHKWRFEDQNGNELGVTVIAQSSGGDSEDARVQYLASEHQKNTD